MSRVLVIGVGNEWRGDDAAGLLAARLLALAPPADCVVRECSGEATTLAALLASTGSVILIDALRGTADAGEVFRIPADRIARAEGLYRSSTHGFGVAEGVELARALGDLPDRLVLYGIVGERFERGAGVTPAVLRGVDDVAKRVRLEIAAAANA